MTPSELTQAMSDAGAPIQAILIALRAVEAAKAEGESHRTAARERKRRQRSRDKDVTVTGHVTPPVTGQVTPDPLPLPPSPQTPQPPTPSPVVVSTRAREAGDFSRFWDAYPHKVGKGAAEAKFAQAMKRVSLPELLSALARYRLTKPPDRPWCNPATWLHQQRWTDQPDEPEPSHERPRPSPAPNRRAEGRGVWADLAAEEARAGAGRA